MQDLTKIQVPFGLLDKETQDALRAWAGQLEAYVGGVWSGCPGGNQIDPDFAYRARPAPAIPDQIDWSHVAPEWKFMARGPNDVAWFYAKEPVIPFCSEGWSGYPYTLAKHFASYKRGTVAWQDSLVIRPEGV